MKDSKIYFPALDGLRFVAFLLVLFHHVSFYLSSEAKNGVWMFLDNNGWVGVDIFFVLTGFLVTLLLLDERLKFGDFSLKKFFFRRVFRLLPLYYLTLVGAFFVFPFVFSSIFENFKMSHFSYRYLWGSLPWYLALLGNWYVVFNGFGDSRLISIMWVVCVDVQFYLLWAFLLKKLKSFKVSVLVSLVIIFFSTFLRWFLINQNVAYPALYTNTFARLDTFIFGAILAFVYFYKGEYLNKIKVFYSLPMQALGILLLIGYLYFVTQDNRLAIRQGVFGYTVTGLLSTYIVLFCIKSQSVLVKVLNNKVLKKLGTISYGLYLWHILAILLLFYNLPENLRNVILPVLALPLSIFFAYLSHYLFEKPFLKIKSRFNQSKV